MDIELLNTTVSLLEEKLSQTLSDDLTRTLLIRTGGYGLSEHFHKIEIEIDDIKINVTINIYYKKMDMFYLRVYFRNPLDLKNSDGEYNEKLSCEGFGDELFIENH